MNQSEERRILHEAFKQCEMMFRKNCMRFHYNLTQSTKHLNTDWQMKHFYAWVANPRDYNEDEVDLLETGFDGMEIEPYENYMEVHSFPNGDECFIHVKNSKLYSQEEEKSACL